VREDAVAVGDEIRPNQGQALLVGLPALTRGDELISDGLSYDAGGGRDVLNAVDIVQSRRSEGFVGQVHGLGFGVFSGTGDWTDVGTRRIICVWYSRGKVGDAGEIVEVRVIIAEHPEVRTAYDFKVVSQAGV